MMFRKGLFFHIHLTQMSHFLVCFSTFYWLPATMWETELNNWDHAFFVHFCLKATNQLTSYAMKITPPHTHTKEIIWFWSFVALGGSTNSPQKATKCTAHSTLGVSCILSPGCLCACALLELSKPFLLSYSITPSFWYYPIILSSLSPGHFTSVRVSVCEC